jgi:excisionase family DNA binding protein
MPEIKSIRERIAEFERGMKAEEVANLLGVKKRTIYEQAKLGVIPSFRIGTSVRFDPQKLCGWLDRQTIDPNCKPENIRRKAQS